VKVSEIMLNFNWR